MVCKLFRESGISSPSWEPDAWRLRDIPRAGEGVNRRTEAQERSA